MESNVFIYFDTNFLRSTDGDNVNYDSFYFGKNYYNIKRFLDISILTNNVKLGVSKIVIQELIKQKVERYNEDISRINQIIDALKKKEIELKELNYKVSQVVNCNILSGINFCDNLKLSCNNFDYYNMISKVATDYISNENICVVTFSENESKKSKIFTNVICRSIKKESPFQEVKNGNKKYSDAGLKDVLIWESLLNYEEIEKYDKIFFVTKDNVFENCKSEFCEKINKDFEICKTYEDVICQLESVFRDYFKNKPFKNYIENENILTHVYSEYYENYLINSILGMKTIQVHDTEFSIISCSLISLCESMKDEEDTDGNETGNKFIVSLVEIVYKYYKGQKKNRFYTETLMDSTGGLENPVDLKLVEM